MVVLNEGRAGEPSTRVEGKIASIGIYSDLSVQYRCVWWNDRTQHSEWFTSAQVTEMPDAEYLEVELSNAHP
jgi:hypothetical protein